MMFMIDNLIDPFSSYHRISPRCPPRPSPLLITKDAVASMKAGSVVVDLVAWTQIGGASGGEAS